MPLPLRECCIPGLGPKGLWHTNDTNEAVVPMIQRGRQVAEANDAITNKTNEAIEASAGEVANGADGVNASNTVDKAVGVADTTNELDELDVAKGCDE